METTIVCLIIFATGLYGSVAALSVKEYLQNKKNKEIEMIAIDWGVRLLLLSSGWIAEGSWNVLL